MAKAQALDLPGADAVVDAGVTSSVRNTLGARFEAAERAYRGAERASDLIGNVRLGLALVALGLVLMPLYTRSGTPWWGLIPVFVAFLVLAKFQDRLQERRRWAGATVQFFRGSLQRLDETWRDLPDDGSDLGKTYRTPSHFADDLDLFGPASLFQLLSRAVTSGGRRVLGAWLAAPASPDVAQERQQAVRVLAGEVDLRKRCYAAAAVEHGTTTLSDEALLAWAEGQGRLPARRLLEVLGVLQPAAFLALGGWAFLGDGPRELFYAATLLQVVTLLVTRRLTAPRAQLLSGPERVLSRYARFIEVVEGLPLDMSPRLATLRGVLFEGGESASMRLHRLERLVEMLNARLNMFFALTLGPALLWELNVVLRAERWRDRTGPRLRGWLDALAEMEALCSLAAFAHERPDYAFAERAEEPGVFRAEALSHPLIDRRRVVPNDLELGGPGSVLLLTGSNMSGKSTLLRSVGLAVVMAGAGGPVPARRLCISELRLASSVRIVDSLAEGTSHFFAELRRLKHIVDLSRTSGPPLLYLLDEVLHGTNSRERHIGAVSVVRWLSQSGALGIVTTHDLELARLADIVPSGRMVEAHFSDGVDGESLQFDYRLRPGPVRSTNALKLMRAVGIDVELVGS